MKAPVFVFDSQALRNELKHIDAAEQPQTTADRKTHQYYVNGGQLLWIDRAGVDSRADSLLSWLHGVSDMGFSPDAFFVNGIEQDLKRMRTLDFTEQNPINRVAARLEYRLTKACLRYAYGQRYGFINPRQVFNNLDIEKVDTVRHITRYQGLFDIDIETPGAQYDSLVRSKIATGDIVEYLHEIQPSDAFYAQLKRMLPKAQTEEERQRIICNMERSRWRQRNPMVTEGKRIVVNIPAFQLYGYGQDTVLTMRVACGAIRTKTPLLTSAMEWMEVNPQWVIPMSIIEKDVARRAGDSAYFARNRYQIYDKATNKPMEISQVSQAMLLSGNYRVAQQSGADNSLGRIVFRFKNRFSVYLHYTSSPGVFKRDVRAVSHGCVRVARPFELAHFVLDNPDEWLLDRIRISMDMQPRTERGHEYLMTHRDQKEHKLIGYVPVKPRVPLYIIYYTLWPDERGELRTWPDVYGYDKVIINRLQTYMQP